MEVAFKFCFTKISGKRNSVKWHVIYKILKDVTTSKKILAQCMFGTYGSTVIISTKHAISHLVEIELVERIGELYNCVGDDTNLANVICYKLLLIPLVFFLRTLY